MELSNLTNMSNHNYSTGRPSSTLTDKEWQTELEIRKLYIKPYDKNIKRLGGRYSSEYGRDVPGKKYDGSTGWQSYCYFINDVMKQIRSGFVEYCYYYYQITELLHFHYDDLRTRYIDGYWEVWLEKQ